VKAPGFEAVVPGEGGGTGKGETIAKPLPSLLQSPSRNRLQKTGLKTGSGTKPPLKKPVKRPAAKIASPSGPKPGSRPGVPSRSGPR
jgi:hypothetical protein